MPDQLDPCRVLGWYVCASCRRLLGERKESKDRTVLSAHSWSCTACRIWLPLGISQLSTLFPRREGIWTVQDRTKSFFLSCWCNIWMRNACCSLGVGAWLCSALCGVHWNVRFECWDTMLFFESVWTFEWIGFWLWRVKWWTCMECLKIIGKHVRFYAIS